MELTGTFQLALLFMKVVDCVLTSQNDTFGNIVVYHSSITQSSCKLYEVTSPAYWPAFGTSVMLALICAASLSTCTDKNSCVRG